MPSGISQALKELDGIDALEIYPVNAPANRVVISEAPRKRTVRWRKTQAFELNLPFVHYNMRLYDIGGETSWYINSIGCSPTALSDEHRYVSPPPLPNFYHGFSPCAETNGETIIESIITFWSSGFSTDGRLARNQTWEELKNRSGFLGRNRIDVLKWWEENLSIEDVLALPWPPAISYNAITWHTQ